MAWLVDGTSGSTLLLLLQCNCTNGVAFNYSADFLHCPYVMLRATDAGNPDPYQHRDITSHVRERGALFVPEVHFSFSCLRRITLQYGSFRWWRISSQGVGCVQAISSQVSRGMLVKDICVEKEVGNFLGLSITKIGADHACLSVDGGGFPLTLVFPIHIQKSVQKSLQECLSN